MGATHPMTASIIASEPSVTSQSGRMRRPCRLFPELSSGGLPRRAPSFWLRGCSCAVSAYGVSGIGGYTPCADSDDNGTLPNPDYPSGILVKVLPDNKLRHTVNVRI